MDPLAPFIEHDARRNRGLVIVSSFFLVAAVTCVVAPIDDLAGQLLLIGLFGGVGLGLGAMAFKGYTRPNAAVEVLRTRPEDVAWIHPIQSTDAGIHETTSFRLYLRDRTMVGATVRADAEAEIIEVLRSLCPDADYGYDPDLVVEHTKPGHGAGVDAWAPVPQGDAAIEPLLHALTQQARPLLWFGIPSVLIAGLCTAMSISVLEPLPIVLAGLFALAGALLLRAALRPARRHPLVQALLDDGATVESVTLRYVWDQSDTVPELRVSTRRGKLYIVHLLPGTEKPLLAELRHRLPHAVR